MGWGWGHFSPSKVLLVGPDQDVIPTGDYDKDGDDDLAVWRPSTGQWFVKDQSTTSYGLPGDVPVPADYDGDGDTDIAIFRPSTGQWFIKDQFTVSYGLNGDVPAPLRPAIRIRFFSG